MSSFLFAFLIILPTQAYIPSYWHTISRTAANHGRGLYLIDQEVALTRANEPPLIVREQWLVRNGKEMRLRAQGRRGLEGKLDLTHIYSDSEKTFIDAQGKKKTLKISSDWFESFFHFRTPEGINPQMLTLKMIPQEALKRPTSVDSLEDIKYEPQNFIRLGRSQGAISYAIGEPSKKNQLKPGLWIQQDAFTISKIRLPSQAEISAKDYREHKKNLWLPKQRKLTWNNNRAHFRILSVKTLGSQKRNRLKPKNLNLRSEPHLAKKMPDHPLLREFYEKFR